MKLSPETFEELFDREVVGRIEAEDLNPADYDLDGIADATIVLRDLGPDPVLDIVYQRREEFLEMIEEYRKPA